MEITINHQNKNKYRNGTFPEVTGIVWKLGELNDLIKNFPNLKELKCTDNEITSLDSF